MTPSLSQLHRTLTPGNRRCLKDPWTSPSVLISSIRTLHSPRWIPLPPTPTATATATKPTSPQTSSQPNTEPPSHPQQCSQLTLSMPFLSTWLSRLHHAPLVPSAIARSNVGLISIAMLESTRLALTFLSARLGVVRIVAIGRISWVSMSGAGIRGWEWRQCGSGGDGALGWMRGREGSDGMERRVGFKGECKGVGL